MIFLILFIYARKTVSEDAGFGLSFCKKEKLTFSILNCLKIKKNKMYI